jgi:hypothetical protein
MAKLILVCSFFLFVFSAGICFATNEKPLIAEKTELKKQACKTSEKLIPEKLLRVKPLDLKAAERPPQSGTSLKTPSPANTFETLITPFIKAVAPHFYDQIIKKQPKSSPVRS